MNFRFLYFIFFNINNSTISTVITNFYFYFFHYVSGLLESKIKNIIKPNASISSCAVTPSAIYRYTPTVTPGLLGFINTSEF